MTSEKVNPVDHSTASILLINAMSKHCPNSVDMKEMFGIERPAEGPVMLDVELIVNGVSVPFKHTVEDVWRQLCDKRDEKLLEMAKKLVSSSALEPLMDALQTAQWDIEQALEKVLKKAQEDGKS